MKDAKKFLEESGIKTVFDQNNTLTNEHDDIAKDYHNLQPSFEDFLEEEFENLKIIESKREVFEFFNCV